MVIREMEKKSIYTIDPLFVLEHSFRCCYIHQNQSILKIRYTTVWSSFCTVLGKQWPFVLVPYRTRKLSFMVYEGSDNNVPFVSRRLLYLQEIATYWRHHGFINPLLAPSWGTCINLERVFLFLVGGFSRNSENKHPGFLWKSKMGRSNYGYRFTSHLNILQRCVFP